MTSTEDHIAQLLLDARIGMLVDHDAQPRNRAWAQESYRRSSEAAIATPRGPVKLSSTGVTALERGVEALWRFANVRRLWLRDDLWSVCTFLVASIPDGIAPDLASIEIKRALLLIQAPADTLVSFPLGNAKWTIGPISVGGLTFGCIARGFQEAVNAISVGRPSLPMESPDIWWLNSLDPRARDLVAVGGHFNEHMGKAIEVAESRLRTILGVALLCQLDLDTIGLHSGRGSSHQPGVRGLVLDRGALNELAQDVPNLRDELINRTYALGASGGAVFTRWYSELPFPLDTLLEQPLTRERAHSAATVDDSTWLRLATAARWYAKAFWAEEHTDMVLACGVGFDALLAESGGSPGRVLAERFALLEADRSVRRQRAKRFADIYELRSAVAHGAKSTAAIDEVREIERDLRWAAIRFMELLASDSIRTEADHRNLFESLKWGG